MSTVTQQTTPSFMKSLSKIAMGNRITAKFSNEKKAAKAKRAKIIKQQRLKDATEAVKQAVKQAKLLAKNQLLAAKAERKEAREQAKAAKAAKPKRQIRPKEVIEAEKAAKAERKLAREQALAEKVAQTQSDRNDREFMDNLVTNLSAVEA